MSVSEAHDVLAICIGVVAGLASGNQSHCFRGVFLHAPQTWFRRHVQSGVAPVQRPEPGWRLNFWHCIVRHRRVRQQSRQVLLSPDVSVAVVLLLLLLLLLHDGVHLALVLRVAHEALLVLPVFQVASHAQVLHPLIVQVPSEHRAIGIDPDDDAPILTFNAVTS